MSSVGSATTGADGTVVVTTDAGGNDEHDVANTSGGSGSGANKSGQLSLTPRFTQEEKEILYSLFHQYESIIDIKYRKKQRSKYSVRDTWEHIAREFNSHPGVSAMRNLKQIQKFWLNARLRKQYPFRGNNQKGNNNVNSGGGTQQQLVNHAIKDEPDFQLSTNETPEHNSQTDEFEEIEMDTGGVTQLEEDPINPQPTQQDQQQQLQQHVHQQQQQQQQQAQPATIQTQQISVDQISAEKLTLNDLLQFKTSRPREDIILQIKHSNEPTAHITLPSPTRITIPAQHPQQHTMATITANGYNQQIISEIKPQQITLAQYQAQQQLQQQQQQLAQQQLAVAAQQQHQQQQQQQQQQQVKMQLQSSATQQFATAAPTFTCTTFNALPVATAAPAATVTATPAVAAAVTVDSFEEKINYFKLKEAELRFKEEQVLLEKKKIELNRAQEELKHIREVHRLQVEELKMKIRILQEEEKILRKNQTGVHT